MKIIYIVLGVAALLGIVVILGRSGSSSQPPVPANITDDDIRQLAQQGRKIEAIKWYRSLHGGGLKEAKEAVEAMMSP